MWQWAQRWLEVIFLHWRVPAWELRPLVPAPLELDVLDGDAWISLVFFRLTVRPRWLPFLPGLSSLVELNLRTYVSLNGQPGIYFLRIHADNRAAMWLARRLTPLPYQPARLRHEQVADTGYWCDCQDHSEPSRGLALQLQPAGELRSAADAPADCWLLERYRLYAPATDGKLLQADVEHPRWHVRRAEVRIHRISIARDLGLKLSDRPDALHFSPGLAARFGTFSPVNPRLSIPSRVIRTSRHFQTRPDGLLRVEQSMTHQHDA